MKKVIIFLFIISSLTSQAQNQGVSNWWNFGYGSFWGAPFGQTLIDFSSGAPVITYDSLEMDFNRTSANISDSAGNLLFYTNGYYIADATHDTMLNGNNISPTGFQITNPYGLTVPQACLILPYPDSSHLYYLFHSTVDNAPFYINAHYIYVSLIDMNLNGGLGAVVSKNEILLQDTLNPGKITACKHANGRDWWVVCQRAYSNIYYKFLVTPTAIFGPYSQSIGIPRTWSVGMAGFSPDGSKYAYFHAEYLSDGSLEIMDFDRCSGMFSNSIHITIPQSTSFSGGMAFSPNSRFLYTANIDLVYQFDMSSTNILSSQTTVAVWDSFYSPSPPFATLFDVMQLAPDGKIYISTGNGTFHMHVINQPDSLICDLVQHPIQFQTYYANGLPNHPNYFLGCDTTGGCPCLTTGIHSVSADVNTQIKVFPNPASGPLTLRFDVQDNFGILEIFDIMGKKVIEEHIAPWSQFKKLDILPLSSGIYTVRIQWNKSFGSVKFIKE